MQNFVLFKSIFHIPIFLLLDIASVFALWHCGLIVVQHMCVIKRPFCVHSQVEGTSHHMLTRWPGCIEEVQGRPVWPPWDTLQHPARESAQCKICVWPRGKSAALVSDISLHTRENISLHTREIEKNTFYVPEKIDISTYQRNIFIFVPEKIHFSTY